MLALTGFLKPCYVYAPRTLVRRVAMTLVPARQAHCSVRLPWGAVLQVNPQEGIGRELIRQNIFDIAVSETAWRLLEAGDTAVDVGANIGYMSSLFAHRVGLQGQVESFEPHPRIFSRLQRNLLGAATRPTAALRLHECALGDRDGSAQLLEPGIFGINEGASVVAQQALMPGSAARDHRFTIKVARFDTLMSDRDVALLKVDVEGFESQVLSGAADSLAHQRIRHIIYEAHECEHSALHALLTHYGYAIFGIGHDLRGPKLTPGSAPPRIDRRWESPSYLATVHPREVVGALQPRGWQVLQRC